MRTLDDELLFIFRLIKRQNKTQKWRVFNSLSEQQKLIVTDDLILFLTQNPDSKEIRCNFRLRIDEIFGTLRTDNFLFIIDYNAILFMLDLEDYKLYYWLPEKDSTYAKLVLWGNKTRIETLWLKLLSRIKNLMQ